MRCADYCCVLPHPYCCVLLPHLRADELVLVRRGPRRRARKGHTLGQREQPQPTTAWWVGGGAVRAVSSRSRRVLCALPVGLRVAQLPLRRT